MESSLALIKCRLGLVVLATCIILSGGCAQPNNHPVISELEAESARVALSGVCEIGCVAVDADGDDLTYTWSADGGTFSGEGPAITWLAPSVPGAYNITVTVTDGKGGEATAQLAIEVPPNKPPAIESLTADSTVLSYGESTTIKCAASDPDGDELSYVWSATGGDISGQDAVIEWTAPSRCTTYLITVIVTDGKGGEVGEELDIRVRKPG